MENSMKDASYVIIKKGTLEAVFETYNKKLLKHINTKKYKAIPIYEYLTKLNENIKNESRS